jgi:N-carbamoylputrescine amidase
VSAGRTKIKIAGIQIVSTEDIERNLQKAFQFIRHAAEGEARILCFPQLFFLPWFLGEEEEDFRSYAISRQDEILSRMGEAARQHEVVLVCPFYEKGNGKDYSSVAVFDRDGTPAGIYQKAHIPDIPGWKEKFYFHPGETGFPVFQTAYGRIGVQLCWDNFFPEGTRALALAGAEIVFAPTAAAYASQERWYNVLAANAFVNNLYIFRVNRIGRDHGLDFYGHSFCVNPYGELCANPIGMQESILLADVDFSRIPKIREESGFFRDRRNHLYQDLVRTAGMDTR